MFSKNYATPWYWEMLTRNFKKIFKEVPLNISLYVFGPGDDPKEVATPAELLTVSVRMARAGVDNLLYLTERKPAKSKTSRKQQSTKSNSANASEPTAVNQSKNTSTWSRAGKR